MIIVVSMVALGIAIGAEHLSEYIQFPRRNFLSYNVAAINGLVAIRPYSGLT